MNQLQTIEQYGQRVLTTSQLAASYGTDNKSISNNFNNNKHRYAKGKHFFLLDGEDLKYFKSKSENLGIAQNLNKLYLWTEKGAWLHAKSLNTDQAWDAYEILVDEYYKIKDQPQLPSNYKEALVALLETVEQKELLELANKQKDQIIGEMKPKADYTDRILNSKGLMTITQIAKDYGMSGQAMNIKLHELGVQYNQGGQWLLYSKHHDKGFTHSQTIDITRTDGRPDTKLNTKWTQKGRLFLYNLLKSKGIVPVIERVEQTKLRIVQ
ncbi:phage antirepressor KilAC domain-containing protein [Psychrobacillus sp. FSL K6-2843]|uniref:phage antirepressor KilAC domain-containing protein n=1 Tax=Psychrobacillus sp. FSL K6-2843 TaxID=2921549 RepID=UPI003159F130